MSIGSRVSCALLMVLLACKEPVEDRVAPAPPPPPSRPVKRGEPPAEAKQFVTNVAPASLKHPLQATFEDQIALIGYEVPKSAFRPGEAVPITLYWKALADVQDNWQVFMHLDPQGVDDSNVRGFGDHFPVFGLYPTHGWKAGEVVRDQVTVTMHPATKTPKAELWVGMYQGDRRAKLKGAPSDGKNRFKAAIFDVAGGSASAPSSEPKTYRVMRATEKIVVDGKLDDPAWQKVASTGSFVSTVGGRPVKNKTWAKMLYDDEHLYVAFYCVDGDIRSPYTKRDEPLWQADAVEVFLDPSGKGENYAELQVSPQNVVFDAFFAKRLPPPNRGADMGYTVGMKTAVVVLGTLNKPGDKDSAWTVEMAIPFKDIKFAPNTPPKEGDAWRVNLIRVERTSGELDDSAWLSPGNDYHNLAAMGRIVFSGNPPKVGAAPASPGQIAEKLRKLKLKLPPHVLRKMTPGPTGAIPTKPPPTLPAP